MKSIYLFFKKYKNIASNLSYLSILQVVNLVFPLVTYPYLIRVLGAETYGIIVFAQVVIGYLSSVINFGFRISATKKVSEFRDDKEKLSEITINVLAAKLILWLFSLIVLVGLIALIPIFNKYWILYLLTFGICFNELLFPQWFFQGIEKMKYITIINLFSRIVFLCFVFVIVRSEEDYLFVPLLNGIGSFFGGVIALLVVFKNEGVRFRPPSFKGVISCMHESFLYFLTSFLIMVNDRVNLIVIGLFLGMKDVAYYDLAMKIVTLIKTPLMLINQAVFPHFSRTKDIIGLRKTFKLSVLLASCAYLFIFVFSKNIILFLGGEEMLPSQSILKMLGIIVPIATASSIYGLALIIYDYKRYYAKADIYSVLISGVLLLFAYYLHSINLITVSLIIITSISFTLVYKKIYNYKYNLI